MVSDETVTGLYHQHIDELHRFLRARLTCAELARDLAHDVFVRLMSADSVATIANPRALLYRIAGNLAIDHYRANPVRPEMFLDIAEHTSIPSEVPGPEQTAAARESLERLCLAIGKLPAQCRRIFILHKFEGRSHAEIAAEHGITRNAVEKHLIRALLYLRQQMP